MNPRILNRDFTHPSDGWYQIEALGDHPNREAGIVQVIDGTAAESIVNRFNAEAQAGSLRHGHEMLIDHEHFSDDPEKETTAYGWLQKLENRQDGIYGQIRWTATGKPSVDGGDYRFFSSEYSRSDLKLLNKGKPRRVRPLRLDGLTLTNMPNNRGQKPITNRAPAMDMKYCPACGVKLVPKNGSPDLECPDCQTTFAGASPAANQNNNKGPKMKSIATKLGLAAEASEDAILAEVTKIMNRADTAEAEAPKLKNRVKDLETANQALLGEQVDALLDAHGIKEDKVRNRLKPGLLPLTDRSERASYLTDLGFKPLGEKAAGTTRVLNRQSSAAAATATEAEGEDPQANAEKIRNRATELRKGGLSFDAAWAKAVQELSK